MGAENLQEVRIMKPQFANVFNVSVNDNRSECSLSFYHMYMQHNYTPQPKGLTCRRPARSATARQ